MHVEKHDSPSIEKRGEQRTLIRAPESYTHHDFRTQNRISDILRHSPRGFFGPQKSCRTRVEHRSDGRVLHSLENLRRKRVQLTRIAGEFTVNAHSPSYTRRGETKTQAT